MARKVEIKQRGDTLVEVLMAVVILSLVIVGAITLMARGLSAAQTAVEHTQVRLAINGQIEMLRYLRDAYLEDPTSSAGQTWLSLFQGSPVYADANSPTYGGDCVVSSGKAAFYLEQSGADVGVLPFDAGIMPSAAASPGAGLWVEAKRSASGINPAYVDFQVRACWEGTGSLPQQQTISGMRLYDPAH